MFPKVGPGIGIEAVAIILRFHNVFHTRNGTGEYLRTSREDATARVACCQEHHDKETNSDQRRTGMAPAFVFDRTHGVVVVVVVVDLTMSLVIVFLPLFS